MSEGVGHKRKFPAAADSAPGDDDGSDENNENDAPLGATSKRARPSEGGAIVSYGGKSDALILAPPADPFGAQGGRTSTLESPTMLLTGHGAAALRVAFDPSGKFLASCSKDKTVLLWNAHGACENYLQISGHKNAVLDVAWSPSSERVYTASADGTCGVWDAESGARVRTLAGHFKVVNACAAARRGPEMLASVADDGNVKLWDCRSRSAAQTIDCNVPLLAVEWSDDSASVFAAGTSGIISQFDVRRSSSAPTLELRGHTESVTSLSLSPDGNTLLSFAMDHCLLAWDARPFFAAPAGHAPLAGPRGPLGERCLKVFAGASNNFEQSLIRCGWAGGVHHGERVCCGSSDRLAYVWDYATGHVLYALPGHSGIVTSVAYSPFEPVLASSGTDKKVYLGELTM